MRPAEGVKVSFPNNIYADREGSVPRFAIKVLEVEVERPWMALVFWALAYPWGEVRQGVTIWFTGDRGTIDFCGRLYDFIMGCSGGWPCATSASA